jgi:hypothetical protein
MNLKNHCLKLLCGSALVLLTSACASGERFEWGNYDLALYQYSKSPEKLADYELALTRAIAQGKATNRLAPGLLAELGYLKLEKGETSQAVALFREEATQFPASAAFLNGTIARLTNELKPTS